MPPAPADEPTFKDGLAAWERGDYAAARSIWLPLAEAGLPEALFNLGLLSETGRGVEKDPRTAHEYYLRAARAGLPRAKFQVAGMYEAGLGTPRDQVQAFFWFRLAERDRTAEARKRRRRVADQMTPEQIARAELLLRQQKAASRGRGG